MSIAGFLFGWKFESRAPVCFPLVPSRIEQYYEAILALWNQLYINMKSLVSWHYCMIDIEKIRAMTIAKVHPEDHAGCLEEAPSCPLWCSLLPGRPFSRVANLFISHLKSQLSLPARLIPSRMGGICTRLALVQKEVLTEVNLTSQKYPWKRHVVLYYPGSYCPLMQWKARS